jgi:hypothetical protein
MTGDGWKRGTAERQRRGLSQASESARIAQAHHLKAHPHLFTRRRQLPTPASAIAPHSDRRDPATRKPIATASCECELARFASTVQSRTTSPPTPSQDRRAPGTACKLQGRDIGGTVLDEPVEHESRKEADFVLQGAPCWAA